jgi:hypothetical protein
MCAPVHDNMNKHKKNTPVTCELCSPFEFQDIFNANQIKKSILCGVIVRVGVPAVRLHKQKAFLFMF